MKIAIALALYNYGRVIENICHETIGSATSHEINK